MSASDATDGNVADAQVLNVGEDVPVASTPVPANVQTRSAPPTVRGLRPKQVRAAMMLAQGSRAKDVARYLQVTPETVSRWRAHPAFQGFIRSLLEESIEATKLGLVSLLPESIQRLGQVMFNIDDQVALKGISVLFSRAAPLLTAINAEVRQPAATSPKNN